MKLLTSTLATQGYRANDFSFVPEGEILIPHFVCDSDYKNGPDSGCGCGRSMSGVVSHAATTTFKVAKSTLSVDQLAKLFLESQKSSGYGSDPDGKATCIRWAQMVESFCELIPVGTIAEMREKGVQVRGKIQAGFQLFPGWEALDRVIAAAPEAVVVPIASQAKPSLPPELLEAIAAVLETGDGDIYYDSSFDDDDDEPSSSTKGVEAHQEALGELARLTPGIPELFRLRADESIAHLKGLRTQETRANSVAPEPGSSYTLEPSSHISEFLDFAESLGWYLEQTGGGCTALTMYLGETYMMLTDADGGDIPESENFKCLLGVYPYSDEYREAISMEECLTLDALVAGAEDLIAWLENSEEVSA